MAATRCDWKPCRCLRCRSRLLRWAYRQYWRLNRSWHKHIGCPIYGHVIPDPRYSWKHFCLRCVGGEKAGAALNMLEEIGGL